MHKLNDPAFSETFNNYNCKRSVAYEGMNNVITINVNGPLVQIRIYIEPVLICCVVLIIHYN